MQGAGIPSDVIKQELDRVLQSKAFRSAEGLSRLLRFVVERSLEGDAESLKEYVLGSQALDRGAGFDPQADPIVRVQAGRLRSKLQDYYHAEGKNNPVRIALPKGGYSPEFRSHQPSNDSISPSGPQRSQGPALVALLGAAGACAIGFWLLTPRPRLAPAPAVIRVALNPPADSSIFSFAISPDSRMLAMTVTARGRNQLCLRPMDSLDSRMIAGTEGASGSLFWSPDSRWLGFFASGELKKLDTANGLVQTICKAPLGRGGTWNADGVILFTPGIQDPLLRVNANGGVAVAVTKLDPVRHEESHRSPWFLPDGRQFLYYVRASSPEHTGVYLGDLGGRSAKKLLSQDNDQHNIPVESGAIYVFPGYLLFIRQSMLVAQRFDPDAGGLAGAAIPITRAGPGGFWRFSAADSGILILPDSQSATAPEYTLSWVDRAGRPVRSMGKVGTMRHISYSPDGERVAYDHPAPPSSAGTVSIFDVRRKKITRLTFPPGSSDMPVISPDGKQVVFRSNPDGPSDLFIKDLATAAESRLLLHSPESKYPTDWSRDGSRLLFTRIDAGGQQSLWVMPLAAGAKPSLLQQRASQGQFSPDGRWIAYVFEDGVRKEVFVTAFPSTGTKWQISTGGGSKPRWSPEGRKLFYLSADRRLMEVEANTRAAAFESSTPKPLFQTSFSFADDRVGYAVGPGGAEFLLSSGVSTPDASALTMLVNWPSLLPLGK
jgi:hypothetical protein